MQLDATIQGEQGQAETAGLSILDIVQHSCKTVLGTLQSGDRFGLVSFATSGKVVFALQQLTPQAREAAMLAISALHPDGQTNLYEGLRLSLDQLVAAGSGLGGDRLAAVLLLTDGCPNIVPAAGHLAALEAHRVANPGFHCAISTFGFGYTLDSILLNDLATFGEAMHTFIPDASFVGTAFVNVTSNLLATCAFPVSLQLEAETGCTIVACPCRVELDAAAGVESMSCRWAPFNMGNHGTSLFVSDCLPIGLPVNRTCERPCLGRVNLSRRSVSCRKAQPRSWITCIDSIFAPRWHWRGRSGTHTRTGMMLCAKLGTIELGKRFT